MLLVSARLLHRQVTTELALIIGWCGLESAFIECLWAVDALSTSGLWWSLAITWAFAAAGLGCYLAYYRLRPMHAYFIAMVPIVLCALAMAVPLI